MNIFTWPNISKATTIVSQYSSNFQQIHYTTIKRILKYLRGTIDFALCYSVSTHPGLLITYVDSNYARDLDDHKSRSGCVILLNHAPVLWLSCK